MNTLQKSILAITLSAAAVGAGAQQAAPALADPTTMTADEKATIKLLHDFRTCAREVDTSNKAQMADLQAKAKTVAEARAAAALAATKEAAAKIGMTAEQVDRLTAEMADNDTYVVAETLSSALPDPQETCLKKLGVDDPSAVQGKLDAIAKKYGRDVLRSPAPTK